VTRNVNRLRWLGGKTQARGAGAVENDELAFQEDVAIDGEVHPGVGLDTTEALRPAGGIIDIFTGDNGAMGADTKGEVGESG
jgi:hypothetical protein